MPRLLLVIASVLAGCASGPTQRPPRTTLGTPDPSALENPPDPDVTCTQEVPLGTFFEATVCRTYAERAMDQRAAQELLQAEGRRR